MSRRANPQRRCKDKEGGASQTTLSGKFLNSGAHKSSAVEIIDDDGDEVKEVDPFEFNQNTDDDSDEHLFVRRPKARRQRRDIQTNWDDEEENGGGLQDEDWQLKEAMRQSRLDAERDKERRAMYGNLDDVLSKLNNKPKSSTSDQKDTGNKEVQSKPSTSQDTLPAQLFTLKAESPSSDRSVSPLLFPDSEEVQPQDVPEPTETDYCLTNSPPIPISSKTPARPTTQDDNKTVTKDKEDELGISPVSSASTRSEATGGRSRLKLNRNKTGKTDNNNTKSLGENEAPGGKRKRKLQAEASVGGTPVQESGDEVTLRKKIQLKVPHFTGLFRKMFGSESATQDTAAKTEERIVLDEDDEEQEEQKQKVDEVPDEDSPSRKRKNPYVLERHYRKSRLTKRNPMTLAEAMKAQLYFAPPGVDVTQYVGVILKLFERSNKRLRSAQSRLLDKMEWGDPVMPGPRRGNSLDAATVEDISDEKPTITGTYGVNSGVTSERSRSLRSAHGSLRFTTSSAASTTKRTVPTPSKKNGQKDDSDEDDVMLSKSAWESCAPTWKERVAKAASEGVDQSSQEEIFIPASGKTLQPLKRKEKDYSPGKKQNGHAAQDKSETSSLTERSQSDGASPSKQSKLEENWLFVRRNSTEKTPTEGCDVTMVSPEPEGQTRTPKLATKRSRKLSFDSDETDDERDDASGAKSSSVAGIPDQVLNEGITAIPTTDSAQSQEREPNLEKRQDDAEHKSTKSRIIPRQSVKPHAVQDPVQVSAKRGMSEASRRAAAAAEKRLLGASPVASSSGTSRPDLGENSDDQKMQCPMCFDHFSQNEIQAHASDCNGVPASQPDSDTEVRIRNPPSRTTPNSLPTKLYRTLTGESRELKELRVVLVRSPITKKGETVGSTKSADKNFSFSRTEAKNTQGRSSAIDLSTSDDSDQSEDCRGLASSQSQEQRREEPGSRRQKEARGPNNGSGLDFLPLNLNEPSTANSIDDSDKQELMVQYGSKVQTKSRKSWNEEDDENERALLQLAGFDGGGMGRDSDSEDENFNEDFEKCYMCKNLIPKAEYLDHVTREMDQKKRLGESKNTRVKAPLMFGQPQPRSLNSGEKVSRSSKRNRGKDDNELTLARLGAIRAKRPRLGKDASRTSSSNAGRSREEASTSANADSVDEQSEEQVVEMNEISDSPTKCFKLTDEHSSLDYKNQFAHLKNEKSRSASRRGRGKGRGARADSTGWWQEGGNNQRKKGGKKFKKWKRWKKR